MWSPQILYSRTFSLSSMAISLTVSVIIISSSLSNHKGSPTTIWLSNIRCEYRELCVAVVTCHIFFSFSLKTFGNSLYQLNAFSPATSGSSISEFPHLILLFSLFSFLPFCAVRNQSESFAISTDSSFRSTP